MRTFVATNPLNGWDCVIGVYTAENEDVVREYIWREAGYDEEPADHKYACCIHEMYRGILDLSDGAVNTLIKQGYDDESLLKAQTEVTKC